MGQELNETRRWGRFRQTIVEPKIPFPDIPTTATIGPKNIGYWYFELKKSPYEILAAFPSRLTLEQIHRGIADYEANRKVFRAELQREIEFNRAGSLKEVPSNFPAIGFEELPAVEEMLKAEYAEKVVSIKQRSEKYFARFLPVPVKAKPPALMSQSSFVSASDIAAWSWCPESWRLKTLGYAAGNQKELKRGRAFHSRTVVVERFCSFALAAGLFLLSLATLLVASSLLGE